MRLLHYLELQNFKRFGDRQRIELDHPSVLIGPNNCGKTTAIQAIALWSQAVKTWLENKGTAPPKERTSTSINRLNIVSVPVQRTRYFWHNMAVRTGNHDIYFHITLGVLHEHKVEPVTMRFRNQGNELVYCTPDESTLKRPELIETAAEFNVKLLYPMSGLDTEEAVLQPGRIDVLLGQGQTAQVLRNLCLTVFQNAPKDWEKIVDLMKRLFTVDLENPKETTRGSIDLFYRQSHVKDRLDVSLAGRGLQQMLLIVAYLYSDQRNVLLIDEPDAHLEILRQKQIYILLREIADERESQIILATHSEVVLEEAREHNLTLLLQGRADNLAGKTNIREALKQYGTEHYIRAQQRGYVLYVEGSTDVDILRALAKQLNHSAEDIWDERVNAFYVRNNFPDTNLDSELERVEGGFGATPKQHFFALKPMVSDLRGLAILDRDGQEQENSDEGGLQIVYWNRYEAENYFITPEVLRKYVVDHYQDMPLFFATMEDVLNALIQERVFDDNQSDFTTWRDANEDVKRLLWEAQTQRLKLSDFAEEFFRRLAEKLGHAMLLRKGELHRLIHFADPATIPKEVSEKLDLLKELFEQANRGEEESGEPE